MEEFLKLDWSAHSQSLLEINEVFIPKDCIRDSYFYKGLPPETDSEDSEPVPKKKPIQEPRQQKLLFFYGKFSRIPRLVHSMCLRAIEIYHSGKDVGTLNESDQTCIREYQQWKPKIVEENKAFQEIAKQRWFSKPAPTYFAIRKTVLRWGKCVWRKRLESIFKGPQFFKETKMIGLAFPHEENNLEVCQQSNILELGTVAKFTAPQFVHNFVLKTEELRDRVPVYFTSQSTVSEDPNIPNLVENNNINIVISASSLKRLMDNFDCNNPWDMPVIVKNHTFQDPTGVSFNKKVVYIDKPFPKVCYSKLDFSMKSLKHTVKENLCQFEAFSFPKKDVLCKNKVEESIRKQVNLCFAKPDDLEAQQNENNKEDQNKMDVVTEKEEDTTLNKSTSDENLTKSTKLHHNVSYRIWKFSRKKNFLEKTTNLERDLNVLIRLKLDACTDNNSSKPLVVQPKMEHQIEYGAGIPSRSELVRAWASLFFRPFSNLCRVRINPTNNLLIALESCNMQKINTESMSLYNLKPYLGLEVLYTVFNELFVLEPGQYLLHHRDKQGPFVSLLKESEETENVIDLHSFYLGKCKLVSKVKIPWRPIDPNFILPGHESLRQLPATFRVANKFTFKGKKKKKKNKGKKKSRQLKRAIRKEVSAQN